MSLLLATGEQAIVELNSDLFNSTILTTFKTKKKVYLGAGLSYKWQQQFPAYEKGNFQLKIFLPETKSLSIKRSHELRSV